MKALNVQSDCLGEAKVRNGLKWAMYFLLELYC